MSNVLPYHHQKNGLALSLKYISSSWDKATDVVFDFQNRGSEEVTTVTHIGEYNFDKVIYPVYAAESHPRQLPSSWGTDLSTHELVLADTVINTFRGVSEKWEEQGDPLDWYKEPQPREIVEAFDRVQWKQSVPRVAGELLSELICKHPLPNANHRTSVALVRTYLQSVADDPTADFPPAGNYEGQWYSWAEEWVYESKRLLLLRRKPELLAYAKKFGVHRIERKGGIELDLTVHDFSSDSVANRAENAHYNRCTRFTMDLLERSNHEYLKDMIDDGRRTFIDRLR